MMKFEDNIKSVITYINYSLTINSFEWQNLISARENLQKILEKRSNKNE